MRYLTDNRTHYHLGYNLFIEGDSCNPDKHFTVAISEKQLTGACAVLEIASIGIFVTIGDDEDDE